MAYLPSPSKTKRRCVEILPRLDPTILLFAFPFASVHELCSAALLPAISTRFFTSLSGFVSSHSHLVSSLSDSSTAAVASSSLL